MVSMIKDCIKGLGELIKSDGDIPPGSLILVTGAEGSLKSSIVFNMMSNYLADNSEHGLYTTLEETEESHLRNMASIGIKKLDRLHIFDFKDMRQEWKSEELDMIKVTENMINFYREKYDNLTVFALDSLNALYSVSALSNLRKDMYCFFAMLRDKNLTSFLIMETYSDHTEHPEYFLADGILELGLIESRESVKRYFQIRKMRSIDHSMKKHQLMVEKGGLYIMGPVY